jgi:hypothetical protein
MNSRDKREVYNVLYMISYNDSIKDINDKLHKRNSRFDFDLIIGR